MRTLKKQKEGLKRKGNVKVDQMTGVYVHELMNATTSIHKLHLKVTGEGSFAQHKALGELYEALPNLIDNIAEGYQGACEMLLSYPDTEPMRLDSVEEALEYIRELCYATSELQEVMPHTEIVNQLDMVKDAFNSAKYKLLFLS